MTVAEAFAAMLALDAMFHDAWAAAYPETAARHPNQRYLEDPARWPEAVRQKRDLWVQVRDAACAMWRAEQEALRAARKGG